jgi:Protein of unknown function (DUF3617)
MAHFALRLTVSLTTTLACAVAAAQSPPIKPGLWEIKSDRQIDGKAAAPPGDKLQNLKPEDRARIEAAMKQRGMAVGTGDLNRICLSKDSLDAGRWQHSASCKTDYGTRSASAWKWHSVCGDTVIDGEALFANAENYTVSTTSTHAFRGQTRTTQATLKAHWLGADCGELKPLVPKP